MVRVEVTDIEWDTEVDGEITFPDLPTSLSLVELNITREKGESDKDFDEVVGDALVGYLSDLEGYCVCGVVWDYL